MTDEAEIDIIVRENLMRDVLARAEDRGRQNEHLVQIGMRAVIRDIQQWVDERPGATETVNVNDLRAYLMACLITSGAYDNVDDPFGALRREMAADHGQG